MMSKEHEQTIIDQYEPYLNSIVNRFRLRCGGGTWTLSHEDLMQEARIAFLCFIRDHNGADMPRCYLTIIHALYEAVRRDYPFAISYHAFSKQRREPLYLDDGMEQISDERETLNDVEMVWAFDQIFEYMDKMTQTIIKGRMEGRSRGEIGQEHGWSDVQISRCLKRARKQLNTLLSA